MSTPSRLKIAFVALAALFAIELHAAEIVANGTTCSLANAIVAANTDTATGGCAAGSGADLIQLDADVTLTTAATSTVEGGPSGLPAVASVITIQARAGDLVERSAALGCVREEPTAFRLLEVASGGDLTLAGLTLRNGCVAPASASVIGSGGAVLAQSGAALRLEGSTLEASSIVATIPPVGSPGSVRGGAVAVLGGFLEIADSTFSSNLAVGHESRGGAIHVEDGEVGAIVRTVIEDNRAAPVPDFSSTSALLSAGGGLSLERTAAGSLAQLIFETNIAGTVPGNSRGGVSAGGGLYVDGGHVALVRDSVFVGNVARAGNFSSLGASAAMGGAIGNVGVIDALVRSTFSENQALGYGTGAGRGGGIDNAGQIGLIEAATLTGNTARGGTGHMLSNGAGRGGGIDNRAQIGRLVSSTLAGNLSAPGSGIIADGRGGGLCSGPAEEGSTLTIENTLIADNSADVGDDCFATAEIGSLGFNLVEAPDGSCDFSAAGDVVGPDPQLSPLADNGCTLALPDASCVPTMALSATSPAVDQGRCSAASSGVDARGALRPHDVAGVPNAAGGDGCDMGAFERAASLPDVHVTTHAADSIDPVVAGSGVGNLVYTVTLVSTGSASADDVAIDVDLTLPSGVSLVAVTPSTGSWDGSEWTLTTLGSGEEATLTLELTVGAATVGGPDVIAVAAAVTAADGHDGAFTEDTEATSVLQPLFLDGFEGGDATAWSSCAPAGPPC